MSAGNMRGTRSSGIVSCAADVLWMSMVRGMRGVGGVCGSGRHGWRGWCVDERIGVVLYQFCGNRWNVGRVSVFGLRWCGWCKECLDQGLEGRGSVMSV